MAQRQKVRRTLGTLEDYQSLVVPVFGHFNLLLFEMALVEPMLSETFRLHFRQRGAGIAIARHAVMIGMLDQCIIHACTLLEGKGGLQNGIKLRPSLRTLLHPFLKENSVSFRALLEQIEAGPPDRPELRLHLGDSTGMDTELYPFRRPYFDLQEQINIIRADWETLKPEREELEDTRNKISAHLQIQLVPYKDQPRSFNTEMFDNELRRDFFDVWNQLQRIAPTIGKTLDGVALILIGVSVSADASRQRCKRDGDAFWKMMLGSNELDS